MAMVDNKGKVILNVQVENRRADIRKFFQTSMIFAFFGMMESSSVWYGLFRYMTDILDLDVILSNPYPTKAIVASTKKTNKIDAQILANLLRGAGSSKNIHDTWNITPKRNKDSWTYIFLQICRKPQGHIG
ncbi:MAG: Transposase [Cenarchaeum symbiont of Oopsacas minuta]|nr:Transposase [Cenarchaeum symbiont of Oopsacas minuta]